MALVKKYKTTSPSVSTPKQQVIKVNPYENPENVMELMANICSAQASADTELYWKIVRDAYNHPIKGVSLSDYLQDKDNRANLWNKDFEHDLNDYCMRLSWALTERENTEHTQIVVAGGFSSGKSSFLNRLTNSVNLLPTGTDPVSVVKTYLYCSKRTKRIDVKGVNQKNVLVNLNTGVLQAIQHANKSNIYLASVLDKLFVEIPSRELNGLVFIDTPGYNNSDKENKFNGKTDKQTALEALSEGHVLFWFVGSDRPTITNDDLDIIRQFKGRKVVIFNKADKHGLTESKKIVEDGARIMFKEFERGEVIDILAYSALENKVYYSLNNMSIGSIVNESKKSGNGISELTDLKTSIDSLFNDEICASENSIKNIQKYYKEKVEEKNRNHEYYRGAKEEQESIINDLSAVLVSSYNEVMNAADKITDSSLNALNKYCEFINAVIHWDNTEHSCLTNTLTPIVDRANRAYDSCCNKHNAAIKYNYYKEDYRRDLVKRVNKEEDLIVDRFKEWYEDACKDSENDLKRISVEQTIINVMQEYQRIFMSAIDIGIQQYQRQNKATSFSSESIVPNIFDCIKKDDYKSFLHCFENGVDLSVCNPEGYSPLTFAVEQGNNMMVRFMLDHDADPRLMDKRGYNAFHTAVENQYRDICKMLLDIDPDLINTKTAKGESILTLAKKSTFQNWIEDEIENAF